jgi:bloom syndrome protein
MALTATATESVRKVIKRSLTQQLGHNCINFSLLSGWNLQDVLGALRISNAVILLKERFMNKSGIVYCLSKNECADTAKFLREKYKIKCAHYHAGLAARQRTSVQEKWHSGEVKVICATIAFGMGIDKPDVVRIFSLC